MHIRKTPLGRKSLPNYSLEVMKVYGQVIFNTREYRL
jgi:hypothetical protein